MYLLNSHCDILIEYSVDYLVLAIVVMLTVMYFSAISVNHLYDHASLPLAIKFKTFSKSQSSLSDIFLYHENNIYMCYTWN